MVPGQQAVVPAAAAAAAAAAAITNVPTAAGPTSSNPSVSLRPVVPLSHQSYAQQQQQALPGWPFMDMNSGHSTGIHIKQVKSLVPGPFLNEDYNDMLLNRLVLDAGE
jgi:hypothetical protein